MYKKVRKITILVFWILCLISAIAICLDTYIAEFQNIRYGHFGQVCDNITLWITILMTLGIALLSIPYSIKITENDKYHIQK